MIKHNLKWKIYQQREKCQPQPKSISIEQQPRSPNYLIRREVKGRSLQQKNNMANYTKYVLHSNPISPTSSPNTSKNLIKLEEKLPANQPTNMVQDRKHSLSTLSTENRSFKQRLSPLNRNIYTESIKLTTQQVTEQNQLLGLEIQEQLNLFDVQGSNILMQQKNNQFNWLFDDIKKRNFKRRLIPFQTKESKRTSTVMDQVIKIIRTINQPSYRFEASQRQSRNWYENVKFEPVSLKKNFTFSQSQFKIYFSQYFDKHLKLYRIIETNNEILQIMNKNQQIEQERKEQRKEHFKEPCLCLSKVQNQICLEEFRFNKEIKTYGMIDFLNDNSFLSISVKKYSSEVQLESDSQSDDLDDSVLFKQAKKFFSSKLTPIQSENYCDLSSVNYKIPPVISNLDTKSKNKLLSVDYTIIDQKIYFNNINEIVPTFYDEYSNQHFFQFYSLQYQQNYRDLLEGNYEFNNPILDFENEAPQNQIVIPEISAKSIQGSFDKKQMLLNLRAQKNWQSGEFKKKSLLRSEVFTPRSTVQVQPKNILEINNNFLDSPKISISHISASQQILNEPKRKSITKSIHGRNAQSPDSLQKINYAQPDILVNCLDDTSLDSVGEIRKITMSKSQQQLPKSNLGDSLHEQKNKILHLSADYKQFKMVSSIKSEIALIDSQSDSQNLNQYLDVMTVQNKGASPQSIRLETLLQYENMLKNNRSKKKKVEILIQHGLLDHLQEFMDVHRNFSLNGRTGNGMPFISLAASNGHEDIVRFMLNYNLNLDILDSDGYPPLYHAMQHNNYSIADLLIQNGANPYFKKQG